MPSASSPPRADAAPARPGGEARRRQIVREAMRCFAARGFRGTTTRDVAAAVGITEAALYRYFQSKEALYAAIIDEKTAAPDPVDAVRDAAQAGDDRGVFGGLARHVLETVDADPSFLRILLYTGLEGHEQAEPFFASRIRGMREFLATYIERRSGEGAFRSVDPLLGARAFLGMVVDHVIVREVFGQRDAYPQAPAEVADAFVSIFLDGIRRGEDASRG